MDIVTLEVATRQEQYIFNDLEILCASKGYAHVIAYFCWRDNIVSFENNISADDILPDSEDRLIRSEISVLIGLMLKTSNIATSLILPEASVMQRLVDTTETLLKELHVAMLQSGMRLWDFNKIGQGEIIESPLRKGAVLREAIFYGGESAYAFQYRNFSQLKYAQDNKWFISQKGFAIEDAVKIANCILTIHNAKLQESFNKLLSEESNTWTVLPAFTFSGKQIAELLRIDKNLMDKVLQAFSLPKGAQNQNFTSINEFNIANAYPLIPINEDEYILFQYYNFVEALYETPFYWMSADKSYWNTATKNRGAFTEKFTAARLELVFGKANIFSNVKIADKKKKEAGEIDVLVLFADRAIVVQAKSKKLTLEARKGKDEAISKDFQQSIQDSYNQGLACAKLLNSADYTFIDNDGNELDLPKNFKEIYIICVVSEHYPALNAQVYEFLQYEETENILPPFVMDIFLLDVMTEMLQSPLRLLSYINRRVHYTRKLFAVHEIPILSFHLTQNLWLDDETTWTLFDSGISADLDAAMYVRREGLPGQATPEGILTKFTNTAFERFIQQIEERQDARLIDLGFLLLTLGEETIDEINEKVAIIADMWKEDQRVHDVTLTFGKGGKTGLTIHCHTDPHQIATPRLEAHCFRRKYIHEADSWFGVSINPHTLQMESGINLTFPWKEIEELERLGERASLRKSLLHQ